MLVSYVLQYGYAFIMQASMLYMYYMHKDLVVNSYGNSMIRHQNMVCPWICLHYAMFIQVSLHAYDMYRMVQEEKFLQQC